MTDDDSGSFELSRRRTLAALGTIGVASAGAGLGTSAYFSDTETFENNTLTAGELDMGVGYTAHYSDWSDDEGEGVDVRMWDGPADTTGGVDDLEEGETGLPANVAWLVAVDDPEQFLANTLTGFYPEGEEGQGPVTCDPIPQADDAEAPVIELDDVKPGDFGEVTFDFVLCDNPGFVWLDGTLRSASENGLTEPEADDPDEEEGVVELLDAVQAAVWLDDGNNYQNGEEQPLASGSLREVLGMSGDELGTLLSGDIPASEGGGMSETNCFSAQTTHSVVFAWWLPVDHANEIQTDTATFDVGFYTEQCRHNDGSGQASEFRTLFEGSSIEESPWHQINGEANYSAENGTVLGSSVPTGPNSFLTSYEMFDDFELRMQVMLDPDGLNSGIQSRSNSSQAKPEVHGPQAEIELSGDGTQQFPPGQAGRVWGESLGTGWMSSSDPTGDAFVNDGWNDYRIRAVGDSLRVWLNGEMTADIDLTEFDDVADLLDTGHIGLQVHAIDEEGREVRWRDIRIKELDGDEWISLFNGEDTTGWSNPSGAGSVSVTDGVLELSDGESFFLRTEESYDDFEFETWVRADTEGGILFRNGASAADGYRADVDPSGDMLSGSLYDSGAGSYIENIDGQSQAQMAFHPDQWNYVRVRADGEDIRIWVNGITTANVSNDAHSSGYLGLQHLGGAGTLEFRDMEVNPIDGG